MPIRATVALSRCFSAVLAQFAFHAFSGAIISSKPTGGARFAQRVRRKVVVVQP